MEVTFWKQGVAASTLRDIESIVPPSDKFPFWAIYLSDNHVLFRNMYSLDTLEIRGGEVDGTVQEGEVPNVRREHRSDDSGGDSR